MRTAIVVGLVTLAIARPFWPAQEHAKAVRSGFGAVEGRVIDAEAHPVSGAKVYATHGGGSLGRPPSTYTDDKGKFLLSPVPVGRNTLHASKETEGYPDTFFAFYDQGPEGIIEVNIHDKTVEQGVVVRLGPKGGRLRGKILDAETGRSLVGARIVLARVDDSNKFLNFGPDSPDGRFSVVVPPVRFRLRVSAKGFEDWDYGTALQLASGEVKELTISLRPSRK